MPTSDGQGKDVARSWYERIKPETVVDIGVGEGTYAKLMRPSHQGQWTGVEAWAPYVEQFGLAGLYDVVVIADVRRLPWTALRADLIIAGDVLEHMMQEQATRVLKMARTASPNLIVSVPVLHLDQGAVGGNPFECHVEHWTAAQMREELGRWGSIVESWVGDVLAYFWWSREVIGD